jgi:SAM-dependent methyltransferase
VAPPSRDSLWEQIGRSDPLWAVLSWEGTEHGTWDLDRFFAIGEEDVAKYLSEAEMVQPLSRTGDALDFGCGVGRLTQALATRFDSVTGLDVSESMVEQAERLRRSEQANVRFIACAENTLPFPDSTFDLVFSLIVLQHVPPRLARRYISEFLRVLRPGGTAIFQIPSESLTRSSSDRVAIRRVMNALPSNWREEIMRRRSPRGPRELPMHGIVRHRVIRDVERLGGRVAACIEDHYVVRKGD